MSRAARDLHRGRLIRLLSQADDEGFCRLVWAIDALQSGREGAVRGVIEYGPEAVTNEIINRFYVQKWALETLVNELLVHPKAIPRVGLNWRLNTEAFNGITDVYNRLRDLENNEYGMVGNADNIDDEMARIGHRQFDWQRGFYNVADMARSAILFGGPQVRGYFQEQHGLTLPEFVLVGLGLYMGLQYSHSMSPVVDLPQLGLTQATFDRGLALLALPIQAARAAAKSLREVAAGPVAYRPSVLRQRPCILFGNRQRIRSPLPSLIMARVTSGAYYDVVAAGGDVTRELGERFERYCRDLLAASMPDVEWRPAVTYGQRQTPDILMYRGGACRLVIECKAKKMSMIARYGANPIEAASGAFSEIAKAIFQLWRHFSHVRRGLVPSEAISPETVGLVLTLDPWLQMTRRRRRPLEDQAARLADEEGDILPEDRRPVAFCAIEDFESLLRRATVDSLLATVEEASRPDKAGWHLRSLHDNAAPGVDAARDYPFRGAIGEHYPWWTGLGQADQQTV